MAELTSILKKEEAQKQAVEKAREAAKAEIEEKKQAFSQILETATITKEQKNSVLEYKQKQIRQIDKDIEQESEKQLRELQEKQQANSAAAVEYIIKSLIKEE